MNKVTIGIVGIIAVISVFLLLDSEEEVSNVIPMDKATLSVEKDMKPKEQKEEIKIEYTQSKEFKEKKEEKKLSKEEDKKADLYVYSKDVERVIDENALKPIENSNNDKLTFKDKSGKYEAELMVNSITQRDPSMFPQIPIMASIKMPSGEVINAQIDPNLAKSNDKIYFKVTDTQTGEDKIYNISDIANLNSGERASINAGNSGTGERADIVNNSQDNGKKFVPPMPPVN